MQQRVAIARALVMQPRVLLMDEPFGALDAQTRRTMQQFLLNLWDRIHATVVFITHDIDEAILLGEWLVVMGTRPGRVALTSKIDLPRPRNWEMMLEPAFLDLKRQAMGILAI
jgi:ABC-type nitrate/sulfonate/bicarbonate transport system ATPase subunit